AGHSGNRNWKPASKRRPGTTRRLLRTNSDSVRISKAPISIIHPAVGKPMRIPHASRRARMKSQLGSGFGEARLTTPLKSSRTIQGVSIDGCCAGVQPQPGSMIEGSDDFIQQYSTSNSRFIDGAPVRCCVPAIDASSGQVDAYIAPLEIVNPFARRDAIPKDHAPRSGPWTAAEHSNRVPAHMEVPGEDTAHLSATAGYDNFHALMANSSATP